MPSICYEANQGEPTSSAADQQHEEQGQHLIDFYVPQMQQDPSLSHGSSANQNSNAQHNGTSSTSDVTVAAEQMEAIRQLSAVVQKLSSAVDSNNVTMCRLENTVDKISVAVMSQRERVQRSNFSDANGNDDAVSELLDGDDSSRNVPHADDGLDRKQVRLDGLEVFVDADITLLLLGTSDDGGDRHLPGLLRACGVPSKNHQGAGDHILLKKSAHDAIELLRYLVCDFGGVHEEQNPFERVFCSLPSSELRQIRLSLHIAGFGGKREGSKEDACQILTRYLLCTCSATSKMAGGDTSARASSILDDVLPAQDARIALRGWFAQQPKEIQLAAKRMSVKCLNPDGSSRSLLGSSTGNSGGGKHRVPTGSAARSTVMRQRGKSLPPKSIGRI